MGKKVNDAVMDAACAKIATGVTLTVCSAEPADFAGIAAVALASSALIAGDGNGDYTIANGDTSGRKVTIAQQSNLSIDTSGDATHIAIDDGATLLLVTTCTTQTLTAGGTVTVPAFKDEIADAA